MLIGWLRLLIDSHGLVFNCLFYMAKYDYSIGKQNKLFKNRRLL
jgi:hypothetical protein